MRNYIIIGSILVAMLLGFLFTVFMYQQKIVSGEEQRKHERDRFFEYIAATEAERRESQKRQIIHELRFDSLIQVTNQNKKKQDETKNYFKLRIDSVRGYDDADIIRYFTGNGSAGKGR